MHRLLSLLLLLTSAVSAQQDTTIRQLPSTEILSTRTTFRSAALATTTLDTSLIPSITAHSLSDRLDREAGLFIKTYGPAGLSTLTLRGSGAAQSALIWEGVTLNSPMLGLTDLNLLPAFLLDEIKTEYGGNGPLNGNGAIGGSILLNNRFMTTPGLKALLYGGGGSFGSTRGGAGIQWSNGIISSQTKIYSEQSDNNFSYRRPDGSNTKQSHAQHQQLGFTQDLRLGNSHRFIEAHLWYLDNAREIPPHMLATISRQEQQDQVFRSVVAARLINEKYFLKVLCSYHDEQIRYRDPEARLDEFSHARYLQTEAEGGMHLRDWWRIVLQSGYSYAQADVPSYRSAGHQNQWSLAVNTTAERKGWKAQLALRQNLFNGSLVPILPSASFSVLLNRYLTVRGDMAAVYRLPTLNDRYWQPGGNPDLDPESGLNGSVEMSADFHRKGWTLRINAGVFASRLNKALVWLPDPSGIYYVDNIQVLETQGADANIETGFSSGKWTVQLTGGPVYTRSIVAKADAAYQGAIGQQQIYTPLILWKSTLTLQYKKLSLRYYHSYTGYRYTTVDHAHFLDPYAVAECSAGWTLQVKQQEITLTAAVKNLYNETYQVIAWRAMPGRWYEAGIIVRFSHLKKP